MDGGTSVRALSECGRGRWRLPLGLKPAWARPAPRTLVPGGDRLRRSPSSGPTERGACLPSPRSACGVAAVWS